MKITFIGLICILNKRIVIGTVKLMRKVPVNSLSAKNWS